jgi:hypothetical protein
MVEKKEFSKVAAAFSSLSGSAADPVSDPDPIRTNGFDDQKLGI